jgi:hypothetical protein
MRILLKNDWRAGKTTIYLKLSVYSRAVSAVKRPEHPARDPPTAPKSVRTFIAEPGPANHLRRHSRVKAILDLQVDLSWFGVMRTAKRRAVVEQEPAICQIERGDGDRQIFGNGLTE